MCDLESCGPILTELIYIQANTKDAVTKQHLVTKGGYFNSLWFETKLLAKSSRFEKQYLKKKRTELKDVFQRK